MGGHLPAVVEEHADAAPEQSDLLLWAIEAKQTHEIALVLARTSFVPSTMQGKPYDITAAILAGRELGLQPMAALRSMDIINGNVYMRAHMMRGLVLSHGHRLWVEDASPTEVTVCGQRREGGLASYGKVQTVTWTIERAEKMGLAGKAEWKKQPQTMLIARATAEMCRLIAADVLYAMPYATEEAADEPHGQAERLTMSDLTEQSQIEPAGKGAPHPRRKPKPEGGKPEPFTEGPMVDQELPFDQGQDENPWPPTADVKP